MTKRVSLILAISPILLLAAATGVRIATEAPIVGGPFTNSGTIGCPTCVTGPSASQSGQIPTYADTSGRRLGETPIMMATSVGTPGSDAMLPTEKAVRTLFDSLSGGGSNSGGGLCTVTLSATPVFDASKCSTFTLTLGAISVTGSTLINVKPGSSLTFFITQDPVGGHPMPWPPNLQHACMVDPAPTVTTVVTGTSDGTIVFATNCSTSQPSTVITGPTRSQPPNPPPGYLTCWFDVSSTFKCVDSNGQTSGSSGSSARYADAEVPEGVIDGTNATFHLAHPPAPAASLILNRNGLTMKAGFDFTLTGADITFVPDAIPKATGAPDTLVAWYRY